MARILYFGNLPDLLGRGAEELFLPKNVKTVRQLIDYLKKRGDIWSKALVEERITVTVNKAFGALDDPIADADEIAIVSRGLGR